MSRMIRVAYTTLSPFVSGAERSLQITLRHLPDAGVEPLVFGPPDSKFAPWCEANGVPFVGTPFSLRDKWHAISWYSNVYKLRRLMRALQIDLVHANQIYCFPITGAVGRGLRLPTVCHLRDEANPETLQWFCKTGVDAVVCISRHVRKQAEAAWPHQSNGPIITTLVNAVDLPAMDTLSIRTMSESEPGSMATQSIECSNGLTSIPEPVVLPLMPTDERRVSDWNAVSRRFFHVPSGTTLFGYIGQIREIKGVYELLNCMAALPEDSNWHLLIAGRDPRPGAKYEMQCRERAAQRDLLGKVTFVGFLENTEEFYRAIDVAVVPSFEEPLGRIPLEAAAFAKPAVAFDVGGLPDTVVHGKTGWLVPCQNWAAWGETLQACMRTDFREMGMAARRWVAKVADPKSYAERLATLYHTLVQMKATPVSRSGVQS